MSIQKLNINELRSRISMKIDLMICSSSYEERCKTIPNCFEPKEVGNVFIIGDKRFSEYVSNNSTYLFNRFKEKGQEVEISISNPIKTSDSLQRVIEETAKDNDIKCILIDITTLTHECLLILLNLLRISCSQKKIIFAYANASEYSIGDKIRDKWLSKGVASVRTVLGFPGDNLPSKKNHLIILVGYEAKRALNLIYTLEPHSLALGHGKSGSETTEKDKEANQHFLKLVEQTAISYCDVRKFEIFCNDPLRTKKAILDEVETVENQNIIIAPMNNKVTTMGAALAAISRPEIQICYAQPMEYNFRYYSKPGDNCYLIDLPELFENIER